ncbi:cobalt ECF transporter T component CbiQ [Pseudodesulfovibrio senegalensis]|uniref:Cobalt ECF transporter T component CbiQ n=1 Tax=Pseudodesulfovibrio senegalensis TaxID=1721087 RepID=A0A6N6N1A9_9BACT|nr:cobalt ECF transporter T component CbiQ [Pseudodesulfovibrio senegalensis]KAB1441162.1 cobalt ECF transporter T component CbiQ [Pseudodesulfovibrio senegalensis]
MNSLSEPFASGNSIIHRTDPRIRIICAALLTVPIALVNTQLTVWCALVLACVLTLLALLDPIHVFRRLIVVNLFIAFLWVFLPFSTPGDAVFAVGPLTATQQGVRLALLLTFKSNAAVITLMALVGTIPMRDMGPAMQSLGIPAKLCHLLLFTYRYIFVIRQEYETMIRAMQARGFRPGTNTHTYRSYAWLVGMLLVRSWDRAERVNNAMLCRGFSGRLYTLSHHRITAADTLFALTCVLLGASLTALDLHLRGII